MNGSSLGNPGPSGGGFIVRNDTGWVILAGSVFFGSQETSFSVELQALLIGLKECVRLSLFPILVETDSQLLADLFTLPLYSSSVPWAYYMDFMEISSLLRLHDF